MAVTKTDNVNCGMEWLLLNIIITAMVEQNAGEREHTNKKHGKRIKAWENRQRVVLEELYY